MKNQNFIFVTFCLILAMASLFIRGEFQEKYGDAPYLSKLLRKSQLEKEKEKMRALVLENQIIDFQNQAARTQIPLDSKAKEWVGNLRLPASDTHLDLSNLVFQQGAVAFSDSNYEESIKTFKEMIEKYPVSSKAVEARFLLGESYFRVGKLQQCLEQIEEMINHYPESKYTGYLMLRMAQIYQAKNQPEKTSEIYRILIDNFSKEKQLLAQAQELLKKVEK